MPERILVIDGDEKSCESLKRFLVREGFEVDCVLSAEDGLRLLDNQAYDLILTSIELPGEDGIELLRRAKERDPQQRVIVMTANASIDTTMRALKGKASDYLLKPIMSDELRQSIGQALRENPEAPAAGQPDDPCAAGCSPVQILGESLAVREVLDAVRRVADSRSNVLLLGETGTGKELFARAIHYGSPRRRGPFVPINCSAIPENLLESEFFGYERGAFTGAMTPKRGLFEAADGGTLFLDEIGDLSPALQGKLLRVMDDREIRPLGSITSRKVDIRFIAATNRDIAKLVKEGVFREDLYYRLNVVMLKLPPLRERKEDIPVLAGAFLERLAKEIGKPVAAIDEGAIALLMAYNWPGNVRELQNIVERAVLLADEGTISPAHLPEELRKMTSAEAIASAEASLSIEEYTKEFILRHQGEHSEQKLAEMLGITRKALWEKRKRWGLKK